MEPIPDQRTKILQFLDGTVIRIVVIGKKYTYSLIGLIAAVFFKTEYNKLKEAPQKYNIKDGGQSGSKNQNVG